MLVGVALVKVAVPPLMDKAKSLDSSDPMPLLLVNTNSSSVTAMVLLSAARDTEVNVGATWSDALTEKVLI